MITGFLTFVFFFAIVGCVLYGRKLIKTEKVDAVFGNPERAQGGLHWVIVGSSFLLLVWLYYSWDIAKSFFPKSANELCQVGKVNESLLSLKYLFPIHERQLKSTSVIETETENLNNIILEIEKSDKVNSRDKDRLIKSEFKNSQNVDISRFKGLGEMMPAQLKETTMSPENRVLLKVEMIKSDKKKTEKSVEVLMVKKPELRFKFIQENSKKASAETVL